jgi:fatty acid desaturase
MNTNAEIKMQTQGSNSPNSSFDIADMDDAGRIKAITLTIKAADRSWRETLPFLKHQDALGVLFLMGTFCICIVAAVAFAYGLLPWWSVIAINAICLSLVRELEHDLVHNLYFRTRLGIQNLMMGLVWPMLGNLPHPWFRREMHLLHHRTSGQHEDFEERLIGNGLPFGFVKILAMIEPGLAMWFRQKELAAIPFFDSKKLARAVFPVVHFYYGVLFGWLILQGATAVQYSLGLYWGNEWSNTMLPQALNFLMIVYVAPNMLRQISVQILSSWMHYHEDVPSRLHETQVLNAWYFLPLNLFAANFGSTHAIHHFYANQPFYLRQLVARQAHAALQTYGVRYNDSASLIRGNRFQR